MMIKVRPPVVLAAACLSLSLMTINISFLNVGLPALSTQMHASNIALEWILDSYALVFAGLLMAAGSLGDRLGPKQTLIIGLSIFMVGSAAAAMATTPGQLIAARCVMGAGAAGVTPMTLSLLTHVYTEPLHMRRAIGVWAATASAAAVVAPVAAGVLLAHFWWGSLFWVNVPLSLVVLLAVIFFVPKFPVQQGIRFDTVGAVLSVAFSAGFVASMIEGPQRGWGDRWVAGGFMTSAVLLLVFVRWEKSRDAPLIDISLFRVPQFTIGIIIVATTYFFSFASGLLSTQYLQLVSGDSALKAGIALTPSAILVTMAALVGVRGFARFGPRFMITFSIAILSVSAIGLGLVSADGSYAPLLFSMLFMGAGIGSVAAGTTTMVMSSVVPEKAGMASGAQNATRQLGGALGVAVAGSLLAGRYASSLTHSLAGTPGASYTSAATQSLASALHLPGAPPPVQSFVADAARHAFVIGVHLTAIALGALGITVAATACWVLSPKRIGAKIPGAEVDSFAEEHSS